MSDECASSSVWGSLLLEEISINRLADLISEDRVPPIDGRLPESISNALIQSLKIKCKLNATIVSRLDHERFRITEADLSGCTVNMRALATLLTHPLKQLSLYSTKDEIYGDPRSIIPCALFDHSLSRESLKYLNMGGMPFYIPSEFITTLQSFPNLECLLIPETNCLSNDNLATITQILPHLRHLDISKCPCITDITTIGCLHQLEILILHEIRLDMDTKEIERTMRQLTNLRVIDLSDKRSDYHSDSNDERPRIDMALVVWEALKGNVDGSPIWPELRSLDIAGNPLMGLCLEDCTTMAKTIIQRHKHLKNLSLLDTPLDSIDVSSSSIGSNPSLRIANAATRDNCLHALSLYWRPERESFTAHALQAVYYLLQSNYDGFSVWEMNECARLFELSMRFHPKSVAIQMAATACLYHLCKLKRIRRLEPHHIRRCIDRCLDAAQAYPTMTQLQKNVWLTICNDHLLQSCPIDFYRTCSIALESMLMNRDSSVARMTIAIVSIVAPKVSASESSLLSDSRYVAFLVDTMRQHLNEMTTTRDNASHFALKFTLSALWNLTDECAMTCTQIVENGGIKIAFKVLIECNDNQNIRTKVLGLLNNIAEVPELQSYLLNSEYLRFLCDLLLEGRSSSHDDISDEMDKNHSNHRIDVPYFAAGILSNLVTSNCSWKGLVPSRIDINRHMVDAVTSWPRLTYAMVAYRSFTPFFNLLSRFDCPGAQLWAVWAVEHVCIGGSVDGEYMRRLRTEGGVSLLEDILHPCSLSSIHVKSIASRILSFV